MRSLEEGKLKALIPPSKRSRARYRYVAAHATDEVWQAFEGRQITVFIAEQLAHLPPEIQRSEVARLTKDKAKVIVLPETEARLRIEQAKEQARKDRLARPDPRLNRLSLFELEFLWKWLSDFVEDYIEEYSYQEMCDMAGDLMNYHPFVRERVEQIKAEHQKKKEQQNSRR